MNTTRNKPRAGDGRVPPQAIEAEEAVLGAMLLSPAVVDDIVEMLLPSDFLKPRHAELFALMVKLHRIALPVQPEMLRLHAGDNNTLTNGSDEDNLDLQRFLAELTHSTPSITQATKYAGVLLRVSQQRQTIGALTGGVEMVYGDADPLDAIHETRLKLEQIEYSGRVGSDIITGETFMGAPSMPYDWVQAQILEHDDRLILTGGEGAGKTSTVLQWAVMAACGAHWWTTTKVKAKRVLVVDMELGQKRMRRKMDRLGLEADYEMDGWRNNMAWFSRPASYDITTRQGSAWLSQMVDEFQPDLIVLSPIYRLVGVAKPGDTGGEDVAKRAAFAIDKIRDRAGCALLAEMHAAKGEQGRGRDLRPFGSAVWLRWPEFGYGLARQDPAAQGYHPDNRAWVPWRGDRDFREWPNFFTYSATGNGWPLRAMFDEPPSWMAEVIRMGTR